MIDVGQWVDFLEDIFRKIASQRSEIALITHLTPDAIVASIFLKKTLESLDASVEIIPSLPEDLLFTMEGISSAEVAILVDFVPLGPGPIQVAQDFFPGGLLTFDHEDLELRYELKEAIRLNPRIFSLNLPTSYSAYLISERLDPTSQDISWLVQVGSYGEMTELGREAEDKGRRRGATSKIYRAIYSLTSILGKEGAKIALSTLESSLGEFSILNKEDPLHALFWNEAKRCWEKIKEELSKKRPLVTEKNVIVMSTKYSSARFFLAELGSRKYRQRLSVACYKNEVLARVHVRSRRPLAMNIHEKLKEILPLRDASLVGREDCVDICVRLEFLDELLRHMMSLSKL